MPIKRTAQEQKRILQLRKEQAHRLEEIATSLYYENVKALCDSIDFKRGEDIYYRAKKGLRNFNKEFLDALKKRYGLINISYILTGSGSPLLGEYAPSNDQKPQIKYAPTECGLIEIICSDNSMADVVQKGDKLKCLEIDKNGIPVYGDIYVIRIGSIDYIRYIWPDGDKLRLKANNSSISPEMSISMKQVNKVFKVKQLIRLVG